MNKTLISLLSAIGVVGFWLLVSFLFVSMPAHADAKSDAKEFCAAYEEKSGYGCQVERCRCSKSETELKRWNRKMRFDLCACVNTKAYNVYLEKEAAERNRNRCNTNADCSDGIFCNGEEVCRTDGRYRVISPAGNGTCVPGEAPCANGLCNEREKSCKTPCEDKDGDGYKAMHCGGDDCDDNDPNRNPGNKEICDSQGIDEDCNPRTVGDLDADGDGYISMKCR